VIGEHRTSLSNPQHPKGCVSQDGSFAAILIFGSQIAFIPSLQSSSSSSNIQSEPFIINLKDFGVYGSVFDITILDAYDSPTISLLHSSYPVSYSKVDELRFLKEFLFQKKTLVHIYFS